MKKSKIILGTIALILTIVMCEKESITKISYVHTEPGGCNGREFDELKSTMEEHNDTLIFTIKNDTFDVYAGLNYICCTPFTTSARTTADSIIITITDPCTLNDASCYCWCMCYYTWDFFFVNYEKKKYNFKVTLIDPHIEQPVVFREGIVDLSRSQ